VAGGVSADDDRAGAAQDQQPRASAQRTEVGRLRIGQDDDAGSEVAQAVRERAALAGRPHTARSHDEGGDGSGRPATTTPQPEQDFSSFLNRGCARDDE
jgi:hypothetical protein